MNILVFFKTVPVWERVLERDWEAFSPHGDLSYAGKEINCFDEAALELGLRLGDEYGKRREAHCFAATAGALHPSFAQALFAAGYEDVAVLGAGEFEFAPEEVARLLAEYAAGGDYGLILAGAAAGMADTGTVPLRVAQKLGCPFIANALELRARGEAVEVLSQEPDGFFRRVVRAPLLVASVGNSPAVLRMATLRARLAVRDRQARAVWGGRTVAGDAEDIAFGRPDEKRACGFLASASLPELAKMLLENELSGKANAQALQQRAFCPPNAVVYDAQSIPWHAVEDAFETLLSNWRARMPDYALFADTAAGRALAYRLARETDAFFLTGASFAQDGSSLSRRVCASNVLALYKPRVPAVLTMERLPGEAPRVFLETEDEKLPSWLVEQERIAFADGGLQDKKAVVICGAGMGSRASCEAARGLARKLGWGFGLTRAAALSGWGEPGEIVGQSGVSISPEICLVLGASGAGAFAAGIENAARVVAVNLDERAPIFGHADVGVVADAPGLVRALLGAASCA